MPIIKVIMFNTLKRELYSETDPDKINIKSKELKDLGYLVLPFIVEENNTKMDTIAKQLFRENIKQVSYSEFKIGSSESESATLEEKVNSKLKSYKELMKINKNIKNLDLFKINVKYK